MLVGLNKKVTYGSTLQVTDATLNLVTFRPISHVTDFWAVAMHFRVPDEKEEERNKTMSLYELIFKVKKV